MRTRPVRPNPSPAHPERAWVAILALVLGASTGSAAPPAERPTVAIPRVAAKPRLQQFLEHRGDGTVDTPLTRISDFIQRTPTNGAATSERTDVYIGYDQEELHLVFVCFESDLGGIRANMSRRDQIGSDDQVEIMIDTYADERRAYAFLTNPLGVQWDSLWTEGQGFDPSWDTLWESEGELTDFGYVVRMAIPFRSLRFPSTPSQEWGFLLLREMQRKNEQTFWPQISSEIDGRLNQAAKLTGIENISPGRNIQLIPYATGRAFRLLDDEAEGGPRFEDDGEVGVGLDAKLVLMDSLVLDFTANPDFGQVESDSPQVTVNQRFEVFFPEKRPFFLENANYFNSQIDLLFSRRIRDPELGSRVTGKIGPWAIGGLLIDDEAPGKAAGGTDPLRGDSAKVGVLRVNRDVGRQSTVGLFFTDRELGDGHSRVIAVDGRIKLTDNWINRFQLAHSDSRPVDGSSSSDGETFEVELNRNGRQFFTHIHYRDVDETFRTDLGFIPRRGIRDFHHQIGYRLRPEGERLISWGPTLFWQWIEDRDGKRLDWEITPSVDFELPRRSSVNLAVQSRRELLRPQDFSVLDDDRDYSAWAASVGARSDLSNWLTADVEARVGTTINFVPPEGERPVLAGNFQLELQATLQPVDRLRIENRYLFTRLESRDTGERVFRDQILRSRWSWQQDRRLTLRAILQFEDTAVNPELTRLAQRRSFNVDFLATYQINAWTAVYLGYNSNFRNRELIDEPGFDRRLEPTGTDLNDDSRQFFIKVSYLLRF